jgi:hypothetical protein
MGWSFRKSFPLLAGVRLNLSKSGPRISVGVPGARASIDLLGKARIYAAKGPLHYQKSFTAEAPQLKAQMRDGLSAFIKRAFGRH